jgi:multiple sugar transport system substrate-binding protein
MMYLSRLLAAAALTLAPLTPALADDVHLDVLYAWPAHKAFHEPLAAAYEAQHPSVKIDYRAPAPSYTEAVQLLIRAKMAGQLPDIHYVGFNLLKQLVTRDLVKPIDDLVAKDQLLQHGYAANVLELGQVNGHQYGIPFAMSTPIVFYNADLVAKAGGDPDHIPTNWDDFIALAGKIAALGGDTAGMYYDVGPDDWNTQNLIRNFGGTFMNADETEVTFDGPQGEAALNLFKRFLTEGGQPAVEQRAARQMFTAGKMGFYFASPNGILGFENDIGDRFKLRTAPLPLAGPDSAMSTGGMAAVILTDDPVKRAAAWDYIKFATRPEGQTIIVKNTGYMPVNTLALGDDYLGKFYEEHPNWKTGALQLPLARPWFAWPGSNAVEITKVISDDMVGITNGADPKETLAKMASEVRALIAKGK